MFSTVDRYVKRSFVIHSIQEWWPRAFWHFLFEERVQILLPSRPLLPENNRNSLFPRRCPAFPALFRKSPQCFSFFRLISHRSSGCPSLPRSIAVIPVMMLSSKPPTKKRSFLLLLVFISRVDAHRIPFRIRGETLPQTLSQKVHHPNTSIYFIIIIITSCIRMGKFPFV